MRETEAQTFEVSSNNGETINRVAETSASACDPYDPANLRLSSEYLKSGGVRKLLTTVPVRRPNKQEFVRVHPDLDYRLCGVAVIELTEEQETYLVAPKYAYELNPEEFATRNIFTVVNRQVIRPENTCQRPGRRGNNPSYAHGSASEPLAGRFTTNFIPRLKFAFRPTRTSGKLSWSGRPSSLASR